MREYIDLKPIQHILPGYIRLSMKTISFESMIKVFNDAEKVLQVLQDISKSDVLTITYSSEFNSYRVFTRFGVLNCTIRDDKGLLITSFSENDLMKQNDALKNGVIFKVNPNFGIIVKVVISEYSYYYDYVNGKLYEDREFMEVDSYDSLKMIQATFSEYHRDVNESDIEENETYVPEKAFANLLDKAEKYSLLASELEELKAATAMRLFYLSIKTVDYNRIDRIAYGFQVDSLQGDLYKVSTLVFVEDKNEKKNLGEIISIIQGDITEVWILFNEQIDISLFLQQGWIGLAFSSVSKEVQTGAIEKLRSGDATAKYMDAVFGKNKPDGFEEKDLSELKTKLLNKKYPPNDSQLEAIYKGIGSKDIYLVMGPPGTGKTTVILEWVKYFVEKENKRVLISSQNNKAVDNVIARLAEEKDIDIIRIGSEAKIQSEVVPYIFENKIASLRKSIATSTDTSVQQINNVISLWNAFGAGILPLVEVHSKLNSKYEEITRIIEEELMPNYLMRLNIFNNYESIHLKATKLEDEVNKSIATESTRNTGENSFTRGIYKVLSYINKIFIKFSMWRLDKLLAKLNGHIDSYNRLSKEYIDRYALLERGEYSDYEILLRIKDERIETAREHLPCEDNKWDFYSGIKESIDLIENHKGSLTILETFTRENERASQTIEVLKRWGGEAASKQNYALSEIILESVDLVGATCIGVNSQKKFANLSFDVAIIDEAAQIQVHNALVPMSSANKLIMLGDYNQIPPTADKELVNLCHENNVKTDLLEISLFESMYNNLPEENKTMLDTQYRMPSEIADIISEWFYEGRYLSADFKKNSKSLLPQLSKKPFIVIDTSKAYGRYETKIPDKGSSNHLEAEIVMELVNHIYDSKSIAIEETGIISAYKSQVELIKNFLKRTLPEEIIKGLVATLDSYQGQERDLIIYSFTKSSNTKPDLRRIGFLNELRRLNVAMTRCKRTLILIGDMNFLTSCNNMDMDEEGEPIYHKSEKQFSDFMKKVLADVNNGRRELISYEEYKVRLQEAMRA